MPIMNRAWQGLPGQIVDVAGTVAPAGTLECPRVATNISRTTYARLFAAIGTTWGVGDGATTFGMPWFPFGYAAVQADVGNVGTKTVGENLAHTHNSATNSGVFTGASAPHGQGQHAPTALPTDSNGGAANLAAGVRVMKCVVI